MKPADFNSVLYRIIGKRIIELRKLYNDNQQELADKIGGIKRSSISNIELGRQQISLHLLYRISQVYNIEIYTLLPTVNEIAGKVSLAAQNATDIFREKDIGSITQQKILELLNNE